MELATPQVQEMPRRGESMATTVRKSPVFRIDQEEPKVPMVVSVVASKDPVDIRPTVRRY